MTPAGLEPGVTRTSTDPPPHENGMARKARRNRFRPRRSAPETDIWWICFQSNSGVDHAGHHHQPLLSAVLQGGIVRHSDAAPDLGLSFRTQKKRAEADAALLGLAGALAAVAIARSFEGPSTALVPSAF